MTRTNEFGQPIGDDLGAWSPPEPPPWRELRGSWVTLEPLQRAQHAVPLYHVFKNAPEPLWTYMPFGPFGDAAELGQTIDAINRDDDWLPYAIVVDGNVFGFLSYLRIAAHSGSIEIGSIAFAPELQRTTAATEALYLVIKNVFDLGYRRCEWKCDDLNEASKTAAERLGFKFEGIFNKATHYKGRSRDTAWFAITDDEWPILDAGFKAWLDPTNFDPAAIQLRPLQSLR
ncbi:MAG: GNAT family protein [Acidimicrobiales bacterium]